MIHLHDVSSKDSWDISCTRQTIFSIFTKNVHFSLEGQN